MIALQGSGSLNFIRPDIRRKLTCEGLMSLVNIPEYPFSCQFAEVSGLTARTNCSNPSCTNLRAVNAPPLHYFFKILFEFWLTRCTSFFNQNPGMSESFDVRHETIVSSFIVIQVFQCDAVVHVVAQQAQTCV